MDCLTSAVHLYFSSGMAYIFGGMLKRIRLSTLLICMSSIAYGQQARNAALKALLDSIQVDDQRYRAVVTLQPGKERDSFARALNISDDEVNSHFSSLQAGLDSVNLQRVEAVIRKFGYPGKSLVGEPTNETAYYVIQHSDKIEQYFPVIEAAGKKGELSFQLVAMMHDRLLMQKGLEQIYGTQYAGFASQDSVTGARKINWFLWPVKDYPSVEKRRKEAGFKDSVAENAADQGITLYVISYAEAKKKYPWMFPGGKK
jgi:hypothetical protein